MDRHDLYEICVQSPADGVRFLRALHGGNPSVLAEDFCGTGSMSREWALAPGCSAIGRDIDAGLVARAAAGAPAGARFEVRDVTAHTECAGSADVIFVGNFSTGEIHERGTLVAYLKGCRARLREGGVFVCDTYGGSSAYRIGAVTRRHGAPDGSTVHYTWEHRDADASTGRVVNAIHFRVIRDAELVQQINDAFVYRWRLWSVPELRDAMAEAGFRETSVHAALSGAPEARLGEDYIVCVCARC